MSHSSTIVSPASSGTIPTSLLDRRLIKPRSPQRTGCGCSYPRSVSPSDTGAPPAQPSEVVPPAPGLAVIATPGRVTTLRSRELLMGSVRGSAGHPAAAVAPGTARAIIPVGARCHPSTPNPAANQSTPHAAPIPRPPAPGRGASGSGEIPWRLSWGTPAPLQGSESLSKPGRDAEPQIGEIQPQSGGARPPHSLQSLGGCLSIPGLQQSPVPKIHTFLCKSSLELI